MARFAWILGLLLVAPACVTTYAPTAADRDATVTVDDFESWFDGWELEPVEETLTKLGSMGVYQLEYKYLARSGDLNVYVGSGLFVTGNDADGGRAYRSMGFGAKRGLDELVLEPAPITIDWPDEGENFLVTREDGEVVGNLFVARRGPVAILVVITGAYSSDPAVFERKIERALRQLDDYEPATADAR